MGAIEPAFYRNLCNALGCEQWLEHQLDDEAQDRIREDSFRQNLILGAMLRRASRSEEAVIPLLPAKQRLNHPADWMETDSRVICPDPACRLIMRIDRLSRRTLKHDDVSPIPMERG